MVRYGILGFGLHGWKRLVPAFAGAKNSKLTGIWRRNLDKAKANANDYSIETVFTSAKELCASPEVDAVFVTSPDALHMRDSLLAMTHNKAVLCEKPLAMSVAEVEQMLAHANKANVQFGVAQNFRYNRSVDLIREWVAAGRIGKPVFATSHFYFHSADSQRAWIYDPSLARGGPIGDVGIHCLDVLRYILQDNVTAVTTVAHGDATSGGVEASAALSMDFRSGVIGSILVSFRSPYRSLVEIVGETGVIRSENGLTVTGMVDVQLMQSGKVLDNRQVTNADAYCRMLDGFSDAIEGRGNYRAPGEDGLNNQRVLDAAYASWQSGRKEAIS
ncbi:MAG TPA: Gfo/Idh/MocA family oxidoreductase [Acidobacteriaceae bacterium]